MSGSADPPAPGARVEDEAAIRELLRLHLTPAGFEITQVIDGIRARRGGGAAFDLIVLD